MKSTLADIVKITPSSKSNTNETLVSWISDAIKRKEQVKTIKGSKKEIHSKNGISTKEFKQTKQNKSCSSSKDEQANIVKQLMKERAQRKATRIAEHKKKKLEKRKQDIDDKQNTITQNPLLTIFGDRKSNKERLSKAKENRERLNKTYRDKGIATTNSINAISIPMGGQNKGK